LTLVPFFLDAQEPPTMDTPRSEADDMWSATPSPVPEPEFKTTRRGFEQTQVLEYIARLRGRLQAVEDQVRQLRADAEQIQEQRDSALFERDTLVEQRDAARRQRDAALRDRTTAEAATYAQVSGRVTKLLVTLDRDVEKIRAEAEAEAEEIVAQARSEAHRMQREGEEVRALASLEARRDREEAERTVAELMARREDVVGELNRTCDHFLEVIGNLAASIGPAKDTTGAAKGEPVVLPDMAPDRSA
jgi:cell division septum initiation protein DivIVA